MTINTGFCGSSTETSTVPDTRRTWQTVKDSTLLRPVFYVTKDSSLAPPTDVFEAVRFPFWIGPGYSSARRITYVIVFSSFAVCGILVMAMAFRDKLGWRLKESDAKTAYAIISVFLIVLGIVAAYMAGSTPLIAGFPENETEY